MRKKRVRSRFKCKQVSVFILILSLHDVNQTIKTSSHMRDLIIFFLQTGFSSQICFAWHNKIWHWRQVQSAPLKARHVSAVFQFGRPIAKGRIASRCEVVKLNDFCLLYKDLSSLKSLWKNLALLCAQWRYWSKYVEAFQWLQLTLIKKLLHAINERIAVVKHETFPHKAKPEQSRLVWFSWWKIDWRLLPQLLRKLPRKSFI